MDIKIKDLIIFSVALLIGYIFYPLINQSNNQSDSPLMAVVPSKSIYTNTEDNTHFSHSSGGQSKTTSMKEITSHADELLIEKQSTEDQENEKNSRLPEDLIGSSSELYELENDPRQHILQQELNNWITEHKNSLRDNFQNNLPISILDDMLKQVTSENPFLNEFSVKQDPVIDEQWAYRMEQEIRDVILRHSLSNQLELFSVICKQLTCELTGKELSAGTWHQVFISLFTHIIESGKTLADDNGKNVSYQADGLIYFYSQFIFSST